MRSAAGSWWREARIAEKETRDAENSQGEEERARGEKMENNSTWLAVMPSPRIEWRRMYVSSDVYLFLCMFVCLQNSVKTTEPNLMKLVKKVGLEQQTSSLILDHFRMY